MCQCLCMRLRPARSWCLRYMAVTACMRSEQHDVIGAGGSIMNESITKAAGVS